MVAFRGYAVRYGVCFAIFNLLLYALITNSVCVRYTTTCPCASVMNAIAGVKI